MQRFKNLTKKSGKVASAILSAAMVTSMVLGTNVVEVKAATNDTEKTTDVAAATTQERDKEAVMTATAEFVAAVKELPVNPATTVTEDGIAIPKAAAYVYHGVTVTPAFATLDAKTAPTTVKDGTRTLEIEAAKGAYTYKTKVEYKLANLKARENEATDVVNAALNKYKANNATTTDELLKVVTGALLTASDNAGKGIDIYKDITPNVNGLQVTNSEKTTQGLVEAQIKITASDGNSGSDSKVFTYSSYTDTATKRAEDATAALKAYLGSTKILDNSVVSNAGLNTIVANYLLNNGFPDVTSGAVTVDNVTAAAVKLDANEPATDFSNGKARATYQLTTTKNDGTPIVLGEKVENQDVTLLSSQTKVDSALADLNAIADEVKVVKGMDQAKYEKAFTKELQKYYLPTYEKTPSVKATFTLTGAALDFSGVVYGDTKATVTFSDKDATADADGVKKVSIRVYNTSNENINATSEKAYTMNSAQTNADIAKAAVEAALADMKVTNATTREDVEKVVAEALRAANIDNNTCTYHVDFVNTLATADKEGTADIIVELTDKVNNITRNATAHKTIKFLSNTFVEENGKKVYYNENGETLKNTFLQGTDSPDGYTYYIQNDGSVMQDRLTYHPNGKDVIYFDAEGHEVFDAFVNVKKDVQGNAVDYIGYFGTLGGAYVNQTTYGNGVGAYSKDALFYINDYGVLENKGWFQNAAGNIGYAAANGTLTTSQWSLDQFGRKVYFQANGFLAKGLMTDGVKTYQLDETDGHLVGEF